MSLRGGFALAASMVLCWATGVLAVAALTSWWVLLALVPPAMMLSCMAMMGAMARAAGRGSRPWGWCASDRRLDPGERAVRARNNPY